MILLAVLSNCLIMPIATQAERLSLFLNPLHVCYPFNIVVVDLEMKVGWLASLASHLVIKTDLKAKPV